MRKDAGLKAPRSDLLSRKEAAEYLGIGEQTLAIWKCKGRHQIPVIKVGRLAKYRVADLDRFLSANTLNGKAVVEEPNIPKDKTPSARTKKKAPVEPAIDFAEVQIVERKTRKQAPAVSSATDLEVILPSGITLRLAAGGSLDFLSSVIAALEKR